MGARTNILTCRCRNTTPLASTLHSVVFRQDSSPALSAMQWSSGAEARSAVTPSQRGGTTGGTIESDMRPCPPCGFGPGSMRMLSPRKEGPEPVTVDAVDAWTQPRSDTSLCMPLPAAGGTACSSSAERDFSTTYACWAPFRCVAHELGCHVSHACRQCARANCTAPHPLTHLTRGRSPAHPLMPLTRLTALGL